MPPVLTVLAPVLRARLAPSESNRKVLMVKADGVWLPVTVVFLVAAKKSLVS